MAPTVRDGVLGRRRQTARFSARSRSCCPTSGSPLLCLRLRERSLLHEPELIGNGMTIAMGTLAFFDHGRSPTMLLSPEGGTGLRYSPAVDGLHLQKTYSRRSRRVVGAVSQCNPRFTRPRSDTALALDHFEQVRFSPGDRSLPALC